MDVGRLFTELSASNFNLTVGQVTKDGLRYDIRTMGSVSSIEDHGDVLPVEQQSHMGKEREPRDAV